MIFHLTYDTVLYRHSFFSLSYASRTDDVFWAWHIGFSEIVRATQTFALHTWSSHQGASFWSQMGRTSLCRSYQYGFWCAVHQSPIVYMIMIMILAHGHACDIEFYIPLLLRATSHHKVLVEEEASLPPWGYPGGTYYHMPAQYCTILPWEHVPQPS